MEIRKYINIAGVVAIIFYLATYLILLSRESGITDGDAKNGICSYIS